MALLVEAAMVTAGVLIVIGAVNCLALTCGVGIALACDHLKKM